MGEHGLLKNFPGVSLAMLADSCCVNKSLILLELAVINV